MKHHVCYHGFSHSALRGIIAVLSTCVSTQFAMQTLIVGSCFFWSLPILCETRCLF